MNKLWKGIFFGLLIECLIGRAFVVAHSKPVQFGWTPNPPEQNVARYIVHAGSASRTYTETHDCGLPEIVDNQMTCLLDIPPGFQFFAATAEDAEGFASDYSNEVDYLITPYPTAPMSLTTKTGPELLLLP